MTPDRLRECLTLLHWSQRGLADILDLDEAYVRRMARGVRPIQPDVAQWLERRAQAMVTDPPPRQRQRAMVSE